MYVRDRRRITVERDVLDVASERLWFEIRRLLPRYRYLHDLGPRRNPSQVREMFVVSGRLGRLKERSQRYRDVLREEAWRALDDELGDVGARDKYSANIDADE
ncbi:hypothetical protein L6R52_32945 [Myxococcota bacterium]|nr:hypothetical protein [Myxococcota bacterium]